MDSIISEILKHLSTLNGEVGQIQIDVAILKTQMAELIWWFRAVMGIFIVLFASQIWQIIIMRKNNKK